jgi:hypothetical protein
MPVVPILRSYDSGRGAEPLGEMWCLEKGAQTMLCQLHTHPQGWELVAVLNGRVERIEVCHTQTAVWEVSKSWRDALQKNGWRGDR